MKLLFDQNLSFKLCRHLAGVFPDSGQARLLDLSEADDLTVWKYAQQNGFIIVIQDADFADLAALYGPPPKVIWIRCGNQPTAVIEGLLRQSAGAIGEFEKDGALPFLEIY